MYLDLKRVLWICMPRLTFGRIHPGPSRAIAENRAKRPADLSLSAVLNCREKAAWPWGCTCRTAPARRCSLRRAKGQPVVTIVFSTCCSEGRAACKSTWKRFAFLNVLLSRWHAEHSTGGAAPEGACATQPFCGRGQSCPQPARALLSSRFPKPRWLVLRCCNLYHRVKMSLL